MTFLVGENGSGTSTLVEAVAAAYVLNPEGGSRGARHRTRATESPLGDALRVVRSPGPLVASYFLFLEVLRTRFAGYGFFLLDEPESARSFRSCLALVALFDDLRREGAQVLRATHSPLVASLPGATLLEVGDQRPAAGGVRRARPGARLARLADRVGAVPAAPAGLR